MFVKNFFIMFTALFISSTVFAHKARPTEESVLTPDAKLIAGDPAKGEFFIVGQGEDLRIRPVMNPINPRIAVSKGNRISIAATKTHEVKDASKGSGVVLATTKSIANDASKGNSMTMMTTKNIATDASKGSWVTLVTSRNIGKRMKSKESNTAITAMKNDVTKDANKDNNKDKSISKKMSSKQTQPAKVTFRQKAAPYKQASKHNLSRIRMALNKAIHGSSNQKASLHKLLASQQFKHKAVTDKTTQHHKPYQLIAKKKTYVRAT